MQVSAPSPDARRLHEEAVHAELAPVSARAERTYGAIARYAFGEAVCHPSQELLARDLGCARETVNRDVRELREAGWLEVEKRPGIWHHGEQRVALQRLHAPGSVHGRLCGDVAGHPPGPQLVEESPGAP